jgi:CheY-like chemotaxis protein
VKTQDSLRVLVVDDDKENQDSLTVLLQAWGESIRLAHDGNRRAKGVLPHFWWWGG